MTFRIATAAAVCRTFEVAVHAFKAWVTLADCRPSRSDLPVIAACIDVWNLVSVVARELARRTHPAFSAVGANRLGGQRVGLAVVAMATVVAVNNAGAIRSGAVFALPASIAKALLFRRVASAVPGARVVLDSAFGRQTWAALDVACFAPPALFANAAVGTALAVLGAFPIAIWPIEARLADAFARVHRFLQTVAARDFAS